MEIFPDTVYYIKCTYIISDADVCSAKADASNLVDKLQTLEAVS